jgi:hypothetical protein
MRLGRTIKFGERYRVSLFVEGFNVLNRSNIATVNNTQFAALAAIAGDPAHPLRLGPAAANFATPRNFLSGSPSFSLNNSSYNREFQLGARFDF